MLTKSRHQQNLGVDKILASTKYWSWQNLKCRCRQNIGVNKISASTECRRRQNVGACTEASSTVLAWQNPQQLTSPRPLWCSPPWRCCALHVQSPSMMLLLAALLLWAESLPHCTGLSVPACHAENLTNIGVNKVRCPPRFHWFSPNYSSQYLCSQVSYQKLVKVKSNHHHCPISVFVLITSIQRPSHRSIAEITIAAGEWGRMRVGRARASMIMITACADPGSPCPSLSPCLFSLPYSTAASDGVR